MHGNPRRRDNHVINGQAVFRFGMDKGGMKDKQRGEAHKNRSREVAAPPHVITPCSARADAGQYVGETP